MRRPRAGIRAGTAAWLAAVSVALAAANAHGGEDADPLGPCAIAASRDGGTLYVAGADAGTVTFVQVPDGRVYRTVPVPGEPTGLALSPDGTRLYVTCAAARSTVLVLDASSGRPESRIAAGHSACGPAVSPDGRHLYVCNRFDGDVSVIDLSREREAARVPASREPVAAAVTPDGRSVFVANLLPTGRADRYEAGAVVTVIDAATGEPSSIPLPAGASGVRAICVGPAGRYAYATHVLARYELPTTQVEHGWMNANALTVLDARKKERVNTVLLDEMNHGAANPWGVACSADGQWVGVAHAGTHEVSLIDAPGLAEKLRGVPEGEFGEVLYDDRNEILDYFRRHRAALAGKSYRYDDGRPLFTLGGAAGVPNDLGFLAGLRRRIPLPGKGPRGVAVAGPTVYVTQYFSDSLCAVDPTPGAAHPTRAVPLGPPPKPTPARRGQRLFNDATLCVQCWQSCASCHPDGRTDGLNWDLLNDGMANHKNTRSLLLAHRTPPAMASGVRPSAEAAVRSGLEHILFADVRESDATAIDAYLKSLEPVPSPHRAAGGGLSPSAERGRRLFFSERVGCAACHPAPLFTDLDSYDVGSKTLYDRRASFDTPTLIEAWRTAPYMHDGRYGSIREVLAHGNHGDRHGDVADLTPQQIKDLAAFVLSQ